MYPLPPKEVSPDIEASINLLPLTPAPYRRRCDRDTPCGRWLKIEDVANYVYVPFNPDLQGSTASQKWSHHDLHLAEQRNHERGFLKDTAELPSSTGLPSEGVTNRGGKEDMVDGSTSKR
jgi:hypothetical protein